MNILEIVNSVENDLKHFETDFADTLRSEIPLAEQVIRYIASKKGKRLRPMLVFLAARLHGDVTLKTMQASIVVEMLHTATLVHDDVVDDSTLRRGSPTVNNIWDNKISVLVGDFLFSKTLTSMLDIQDLTASSIFSEAAKLITEGELLQLGLDHGAGIDEPTYLNLISKKTASLFSASCQLGVLSVSQNPDDLQRMKDFGHQLGMAFQIKDDLLDYMGTEAKLGKPTGNDVRENKMTLPLIYSLAQTPDKSKKRILAVLEKDKKTERDIQYVVSFVREAGGVDYSYAAAQQYARSAALSLDAYPDTIYKNNLANLVDFTLQREN